MVVTTILIACAALTEEKLAPDLRCGSYCLYVSLKALDAPVGGYDEFEKHLGSPSVDGYSLGQLEEAAHAYGMQTLAVQTNVESLHRRPGRFACIAHINGNHFVNLAEIDGGHVQIIDPPRDYQIPIDTLRTQWDGTALLISSAPLLSEEDLPREWPWKVVLLVSAIAVLLVGTLRRALKRRVVAGQAP